MAGVVRDNGWYTLLQVLTRKGSRLALDSDVVPVVTVSGENTFTLTKESLNHGALRIESHRGYYNNAEMHAYLGNLIYQNQPLTGLARPALWAGLILFFAGLLPATYLDHKRSSARRYGRTLTGPDLMNVAQFNRRHRFRGTGLVNEHRTMLTWVLGLKKKLAVPLNKDNSSVLSTAKALPQEPFRTAAAVGTDKTPQPSSTPQRQSPLEPGHNGEQEHAVKPTARRFFE